MQRLSSAGTPRFATGAQSGSFNHTHAAQMGHISALKAQAARALSGRPVTTAAHPAGGPSGVLNAAPPPTNYKAAIAGAAAGHGAIVGDHHIHAAIDHMTSKGHLTPFQGAALKQHNGHLAGPQGQATQTAIMNTLLTRPQ
jgi:hypothetical protein